MSLSRYRDFLKSNTARLSLTYLAIIMVMSIAFSLIFYQTAAHELGRRIPPPSEQSGFNFQSSTQNDTSFEEFITQRNNQARDSLRLNLLLLNVAALGIGSLISYQLARQSLGPIEAAMEAQVRFVSDASHELRTPLTAIQASNEVALRNRDLTVKRAREVIAGNIEETQKLQELTNGLLSLANPSNRPDITAVELQHIVAAAMSQVVTQAQAKDIAVEDKTSSIKLLANEHMLHQVFVILLDNAVKYSHAGTTITIEGIQKGKTGIVTVRDQGIGIRASDLPHIFSRFYRADLARTKLAASGYGLGLSIAKQLIELQFGNISVQSTPNKGSAFIVRLPITDIKKN